MPAMRLNQVTLPSADVARGAAFYRLLGLRQIVESLPKYARFECPDGGSTLSLHYHAPPTAHTDRRPEGHGAVVYFECDDLDARVAALEARGLVFDQRPVDQTWLWREAYLRDPDGNVLCLFWAGENRLNPPWRLAEPPAP
jgi:catechol 2,3-dioxygenase-like lactoylglutathione lyase family enzyme